jgi:hypothetical protein
MNLLLVGCKLFNELSAADPGMEGERLWIGNQ